MVSEHRFRTLNSIAVKSWLVPVSVCLHGQLKISSVQARIAEAVGNRLEAQKNQQFYRTKLENERKDVAEIDTIAKTLQEEFTSWSEHAEKYCERVENPRKVGEVQRQLDSVQAALKERERRWVS